jgi:hypothetical protein
VGDRYSLPIVRELLYGNHRFSDLVVLVGAPRKLLSGRLRKLEKLGVIERRRYSARPPRDEYLLTGTGRDQSAGQTALHGCSPPLAAHSSHLAASIWKKSSPSACSSAGCQDQRENGFSMRTPS